MSYIQQSLDALKAEKELRLKSITTLDKMIEALEKMQAGDPVSSKKKVKEEPAQ